MFIKDKSLEVLGEKPREKLSENNIAVASSGPYSAVIVMLGTNNKCLWCCN